jgi:hypothetical protein
MPAPSAGFLRALEMTLLNFNPKLESLTRSAAAPNVCGRPGTWYTNPLIARERTCLTAATGFGLVIRGAVIQEGWSQLVRKP